MLRHSKMQERKKNKRMKTKKIIKNALKHPQLYTSAELQYFEYMKRLRKKEKKLRKQHESD